MNKTKYTIEDLREGRCAIHYNVDNLELLQEILDKAFPYSGQQASGYYSFYFKCNSSTNKWNPHGSTPLPTQPLEDFVQDVSESTHCDN